MGFRVLRAAGATLCDYYVIIIKKMAGKKYFKRKRTKKSYRKKYGKKTFRAKRIGNKMIGTEQRPVRWKVG